MEGKLIHPSLVCIHVAKSGGGIKYQANPIFLLYLQLHVQDHQVEHLLKLQATARDSKVTAAEPSQPSDRFNWDEDSPYAAPAQSASKAAKKRRQREKR